MYTIYINYIILCYIYIIPLFIGILWRVYESEKMERIGKDDELLLGNVNGISVSIGKLIQCA